MTAINEKEPAGASVPQPRKNLRGVQRALSSSIPAVALLTGGDDKPYVVGLTEALAADDVSMDIVGSDDLVCDQLLNNPQVNFLNLRGDQNHNASFAKKILRVGLSLRAASLVNANPCIVEPDQRRQWPPHTAVRSARVQRP